MGDLGMILSVGIGATFVCLFVMSRRARKAIVILLTIALVAGAIALVLGR